MSDAASFDPISIHAIFGEYPLCACGQRNAEDIHHIRRRRPPRGYSRAIMSSVLNACPLCRECHSKGDIHSQSKIADYSGKTLNIVMQAASNGIYQLSNDDQLFTEAFNYEALA